MKMLRALALVLLALALAAPAAAQTLVSTGVTAPSDAFMGVYTADIGSPSSGQLVQVNIGCKDLSEGDALVVLAPSGWTREGHSESADTFGSQAVLWKIADGSEGATVDITVGTGTSECAARYFVWTNYDLTDPIDATFAAWAAFSNTEDPPSITFAGGPRDGYVTAFGHDRGDQPWLSGPGGLTNTDHQDGGGVDTGLSSASGWAPFTATSSVDPTVITWDGDSRAGSAMTTVTYAAAASAGEYDTTPSVTSQSDTAYTVTGSLDAAGDVEAVACLRNDTAPSIAEVMALTCSGGAMPKASDSDSPAAGNFDFSLTLTPGTRLPVFDIYVTDGTTLTTLADEFLDAPTGYGQVVIATNTPADPCSSYNSLYSPDIGIDTVIEFPLAPTSGGAIVGDLTVDNTCAADFDPDGDFTRRGFEDWGIYVSGSAFNSDDIDLWIYDPSILLTVSPSPGPEVVLLTDTAVGSDPNPDIVIWQSDPDLARLCYHPLGDAVTVSLTAGTLATGLSLSMGAITGTVAGADEDEDGELLTLRCTSDVTGGYQEFPLRITPATSWTVTPDCTSPALVKLECSQDIATLTHNSTTTDYTYETSDTVTAGRVISMSPAAGAELAPYGTETLDISLGLSGNGTVSHIGIRIGVGL